MKRFTVPCEFGSKTAPFQIYVGEPKPKNHPLANQSKWLATERGGNIPGDIMESFEKLQRIAEENAVPFEDLCVYALGMAQEEQEDGDEAEAIENEGGE